MKKKKHKIDTHFILLIEYVDFSSKNKSKFASKQRLRKNTYSAIEDWTTYDE